MWHRRRLGSGINATPDLSGEKKNVGRKYHILNYDATKQTRRERPAIGKLGSRSQLRLAAAVIKRGGERERKQHAAVMLENCSKSRVKKSRTNGS